MDSGGTQNQLISVEKDSFPSEIDASLKHTCLQVAAIIEAVCGVGTRAKDVSEKFGLHAKLGWQLWHVAYSDPVSAIKYLPNDRGFDLFREAAKKKGVPADVLTGLTSSLDGLQGVFAIHAEDREMLEMLVDARAEVMSDDAVRKWRKQAFIGNSFAFGVRAKCLLATAVLFPSETENVFSMARVHGLIDLVRTRVGVRWPISTSVVQQSDGEASSHRREPLIQPEKEGDYAPLLTQYCSTPIPQVIRRIDGMFVRDELAAGIVGLTGKSTVYTGEIIHEIGSVYGEKESDIAYFATGLRTPAEQLVSDHIVHKSLFPDVERKLCVYNELSSETATSENDRLDVPETLQHIGTGLSRVRTAEIPNYAEILEEIFTKIGFPADEFEVYRVRMPYPVIPTSVVVQHPLLSKRK